MSPQTVKLLITAGLLLHGIAHGRAFIALLMVALDLRPDTWIPVRSWLFPKLSLRTAAGIACIFWLPATAGFIAAALSYWGMLVRGDLWESLAVWSAIFSTLGILLFSGTWPGAPNRNLSTVDTVIALVVNLTIIAAVLFN